MPEAPLTIRLLGPPDVTVDGKPLSVDTRKAVAILAYLVTTGRPHARDHLAALLWPDADDASARGALRRTLSTLKAALGGRFLVVERASARLEPDDVWADVWQVRRAADSGSADASDVALALRGEFMAGFSLRDAVDFEDWVLAEADAWRQRALALFQRLAERQAQGGDLASAIETARRRTELDRLDEGGHRQLMALHARAGDRSAALRQYRACVRLLSEELGVEPLPETTALHEAILAGAVVPDNGDHGRLPEPAAPARAEPLPLVGRGVELRQLLAAWRSDIRLVLIEGEAGIGKTRLAAELVAALRTEGARSAELRGFPGQRATPYAPVAELLERELRERPEHVAELPELVRGEVARLVPAVAPAHPPSPLGGPAGEARFAEGLAAALAGLAGDLFLVDDGQWLDPATLALVGKVAMRAGQRAVLVVVSRRPPDPGDDPLLPTILGIRRARRLLEVRPHRLTVADVRDLVERLGLELDPNLLQRESAGVPFYLAERLAAMAAGTPPDQIPAGVRELVRTRVAGCGVLAQQVLAAGALIGGGFDVELVRDVSGRSIEEVADALDELEAHGLISADGDRLEVDHELTRTVVLDELGIGRRRLLHRRAAGSLMRRRGRRRAPAEVAAHLAAAGDRAAAAGWYARAAERASALYAHAEAIEHYRAALGLSDAPEPAWHQRIAECHLRLGEYAAAVAAFETAAGGVGPADARAVEVGLARAHRRLGKLALAAAHLDTAAAGLAPGRESEASAILLERALIADRLGQSDEARVHATRLLELAQRLDDPAELAQAHNLCGLLARHRGDLTLARRHLGQALEHAARLASPEARMASLNNIALLELAERRPEAAGARLRQALALAGRVGDRHHEAALRNNLADVLRAAGRTREAVAEVSASAGILAELTGLGLAPGDPSPEVWRLVDW